MKLCKISFWVAIAFGLLVSGMAFADLIEGTIAKVDLDGNAIEVNKADAAGTETTVQISVPDTATYTGDATALDEVIEGDHVKVEADKDAATGNWVAKSLDVTFEAVEGEEEEEGEGEEVGEAEKKEAQ